MSTKLTDAQLLMLSAAAQREDRILAMPPKLKGGGAEGGGQADRRWPRERDQGESGSAVVAPRCRDRAVLRTEADGSGAEGERD